MIRFFFVLLAFSLVVVRIYRIFLCVCVSVCVYRLGWWASLVWISLSPPPALLWVSETERGCQDQWHRYLHSAEPSHWIHRILPYPSCTLLSCVSMTQWPMGDCHSFIISSALSLLCVEVGSCNESLKRILLSSPHSAMLSPHSQTDLCLSILPDRERSMIDRKLGW